jgi:micrococcal nuclease
MITYCPVMLASMIRYGIALGLLVCTAMPSSAGTLAGSAYVIDGDTVVVDGVTVRLKGVDAPERANPGGAEATVALRAIVGNWLRCELTGERTRGREVGYCVNTAGQDIGEALISTGMALSCPRFDPGRRYWGLENLHTVERQIRAPYCAK